MESESAHHSGDTSSLLLSQERLIRKAAGLSHFLTNEVAVAPVSPTFVPISADCDSLCTVYCEKNCEKYDQPVSTFSLPLDVIALLMKCYECLSPGNDYAYFSNTIKIS